MAVIIQNRRGAYANFDPQQLKPGEFAIVQSGDPSIPDGDAIYIATASGTIRRLTTADELGDYLDQSEAVLEAVRQIAQNAQGQADVARQQAQAAEGYADDAEEAKNTINDIMANAQNTVDVYVQNALETSFGNILEDIDTLKQDVGVLDIEVDEKVASAYVDSEGYLVLLDGNGEQIGDRLGPFIGGGGGGGTAPADMTASNVSGWISKTITAGVACPVQIQWSSIENDMPTGNGTAAIRVNGVIKATFEVPQGTITIDLQPYLDFGANTVKVVLSDTYGQQRQIGFNVSVISLTISSSFDTSNPFTGIITFPYVPVGDVSKTVYFILDGRQIGTQTTSVSGKQLSYTIPAQAHGAHSLRVYYEAVVNGETVRSNELYYEFKSIVSGNTTPIISSPFARSSVNQYDSIVIPYSVFAYSIVFFLCVIIINCEFFLKLFYILSKAIYIYFI